MSEDRISRIRDLVQSRQNEASAAIANDVRASAENASRILQSLIDRANSSASGSIKLSGTPALPEYRHYFIWGESTWGLDNTTSSPAGSQTLLDRGTLSTGERGGVYRSINSSGG
jgi:hypothetical protein